MKTAYFNGNTLVVAGDDGVPVVDSGDALTATRKTIAEIKRLTPLPVRFLVNTHWHWDHTLGNGEYRAAFPGVTIISTTATRDLMDTRGRANLADSIAAIPPYLDSLRQALDSGRRRDGTPLDPAGRESIQAQLDDLGRGLQCYKDARVTQPDVTFDRELTVRLGSRAVTLMAFGPGNTPGDAVVYVPDARVVASGDRIEAFRRPPAEGDTDEGNGREVDDDNGQVDGIEAHGHPFRAPVGVSVPQFRPVPRDQSRG